MSKESFEIRITGLIETDHEPPNWREILVEDIREAVEPIIASFYERSIRLDCLDVG